ncbi:MAG: hypothetical protein OTI35_00575 [Sulfitobacter sp.]|nr:hypothetical protein [Sulfitobacter sp.]
MMLTNIGGLPGIVLILVWIVNFVAFWKLCPKAGLSKWWALVLLFPLFSIILLWVIAFKKWPTDKGALA